MEYEQPSKCFKNAAQRNLYIREVVAAFEEALGHAELICLYQEFEPRFNEMRLGAELDQMAHDIIHARYRGFHERLDEQEERMHRMLDSMEERR